MSIIATTWKHVRRSPYQTMAAVITMFITLLLAGVVAIISSGLLVTLRYFEQKPQITVFFTDKASKEEILDLQIKLTDTGITSGTKYVSKDDALSIYREQNKNDPLLLEMVTADILPASLEVTATDPKLLSELESIIRKEPNLEEVVYQKDVVDTLIAWMDAIRMVGGVLVGMLAVDSLLIVMTVIGMTIALKRNEIEILMLVGASPWSIRMPFIFEGGLYGLWSAFFAWLVLTGVFFWSRPYLLSFLGPIPGIASILSAPFGTAAIMFLGSCYVVLTVSGFLLGSFGSVIAANRYIKY